MSAKQYRFGAFLQEVTLRQHKVSYKLLVPEIETDAAGNELPYRPRALHPTPLQVLHIVRPYVGVRLAEQLRAVVPLALYLVLFQVLILREEVTDSWVIGAGLVAVVLGLMLFMEGLKLGLMPFGELIGGTLPARCRLPVVLAVIFLLGIGVTFAEPAIGALKAAGQIVDPERAPYLYALLNGWSEYLVLVVGIGVGAAAVLGTLRFLYGVSLKPMIYATLAPTLLLTAYLAADPELSKVLGLAWDCGAVTTGPVTVPLVLSLGIGIAVAAGKGQTSLSGFGIVTLASLFPVLGVMLLGLALAASGDAEQVLLQAQALQQAAAEPAWYERTPGAEVVGGLRAVVPLVLFLFLVLHYLLRERLSHPGAIAYGLVLTVVGMIVFNVGLSYGLAKLGGQSGGLVPAAFFSIEAVAESPLYSLLLGLMIAVAFAWILGFAATLAEPALNALGMTVEELTNGAFRKRLLMLAVALGVGVGIAVGVLKIVFDLPIAALLLPGYGLALVLTWFSSEEFVNVAWDSAGVTTGPVTVPLVLAMGLGFGEAVGAVEGFGILSMASIGPIVAVLTTGLWIRWKIERRHAAQEARADRAQEQPA
ncbi:MAG TPA: DUF1538 domain-containing protein [Gammaproteobacteria bacterium]